MQKLPFYVAQDQIRSLRRATARVAPTDVARRGMARPCPDAQDANLFFRMNFCSWAIAKPRYPRSNYIL